MPKRVVTSQRLKKVYNGIIGGNSERAHFEPEVVVKDYDENGYLDTEVNIGRRDYNKLGRPSRIKVVIYNLDD